MTRIHAPSHVSLINVVNLVVLAMASAALAQPATMPASRGARGGMLPVIQRGMTLIDQVQQITTGLNLSDDQSRKMDAVLVGAREDLRSMTPSLLQFQPPRRRQMVTDFLSTLPDRIKPVLTGEQSAKFDEQFSRLRRAFADAPPGAPVPTSRPIQDGQQPRLGVVIERLNDYVNQMGLTGEQKAKADRLFSDTRQELIDLRGATEAITPAMQEKGQQIIANLREQLTEILTPEQAGRLRDAIASGAMNAPRQDAMMGGSASATPAGKPVSAASATPEIPLIELNAEAPDFTLKRLDGQDVKLSGLKGRYVLLIFGSYSSPSFRERAASLEQLKVSYGARVNPFVIYTRENYPVGDWNVERNKDDGVLIEQPASMDARSTVARQARAAMKITVPILMDTMDDATAKAYGGVATNVAILIDREGEVVARQKWFEPYAMRRLIDDAMKAPAAE